MNIKEIKEFLNLMREHGLSEIELEKEGIKLKLKKSVGGQISYESFPSQALAALPLTQEQRPSTKSLSSDQSKNSADSPAEGALTIKSPMVGTFYSAPAPDQPPYASAGQMVKEGDVLCIIEAMKLMNEIKSDVSGVIEQVLAKNGDALEFDQPLFRIRKA